MLSAITKEDVTVEDANAFVLNGVLPCGVTQSLSRGLHDAAQPLTVLQGFLEVALVGSRSAEDYRRSLQRALDQSQRIATAFDRLRELVHTATCSCGSKTSCEMARETKALLAGSDAGGRNV